MAGSAAHMKGVLAQLPVLRWSSFCDCLADLRTWLSSKRLLLIFGGTFGLAGVFLISVHTVRSPEIGSSVPRQKRKPKKTKEVLEAKHKSQEEAFDILQELLKAQELAAPQLEGVAAPKDFAEAYQRIRDLQIDDPLQRHGMSVSSIDPLVSQYRHDPMLWAHWELIAMSMQLPGFSRKKNRKAGAGELSASNSKKAGRCQSTKKRKGRATAADSCGVVLEGEQPQGSAIGVSLKSLQRQLKGHDADGQVTAHELFAFMPAKARDVTCMTFGVNTSVLAVGCLDGSLRLYEGIQEGAGIVTAKVEGKDHASCIDFSFDNSLVFCVLASSQELCSYAVQSGTMGARKPLDMVANVANNLQHAHDICLLRARVGRWILTAAGEKKTEVRVWSYDGTLLHKFETKQVQSYNCSMSVPPPHVPGMQRHCYVGTIVGSQGVVIKILHQRGSNFKLWGDGMRIPSPKSTVAICFSPDNTRAVLATEDCKLQLWQLPAQIQELEPVKLLCEAALEMPTSIPNALIDAPIDGVATPASWRLAASPSGSRVAVAVGLDLHILELQSLKLLTRIEGAHVLPITQVHFSPDSRLVVTCPCTGQPRFWKVPA